MADWPPRFGFDAGPCPSPWSFLRMPYCPDAILRRDTEADRWFARGKRAAAAGAWQAAREAFTRARDIDNIYIRAISEIQDAIRTRAGHLNVTVVDLERRFARHAEHGLVGYDLVIDNCHPTLLGHAIIARALLDALRDNGVIAPASRPLQQNVIAAPPFPPGSVLWFYLYLGNADYCAGSNEPACVLRHLERILPLVEHPEYWDELRAALLKFGPLEFDHSVVLAATRLAHAVAANDFDSAHVFLRELPTPKDGPAWLDLPVLRWMRAPQ
jgi:hypothetical protein